MNLQFEWDKEKSAINLEKHKVGFDEAMTVFSDPLAKIFDDEIHSINVTIQPQRSQRSQRKNLEHVEPLSLVIGRFFSPKRFCLIDFSISLCSL